jgi:hypothetical protein
LRPVFLSVLLTPFGPFRFLSQVLPSQNSDPYQSVNAAVALYKFNNGHFRAFPASVWFIL